MTTTIRPQIEKTSVQSGRAPVLLGDAQYAALCRIASRLVGGPSGLLSPASLVHETYERLAASPAMLGGGAPSLALASRVMVWVLSDVARRERRAKRGGTLLRVYLQPWQQELSDETTMQASLTIDELLAVHEALGDLDARLRQVVDLHFFAGLTFDEISDALQTSRRTVQRDWTYARARLNRALSQSGGFPP